MSLVALKSGCSNCGIGNGHPKGCRSNGSCTTGGCNRLNTYNWLSDVVLPIDGPYDVVEVSFNQGARKDFFSNRNRILFVTGDMVAVEAPFGYDVGQVTLAGELVRLQMRKKKVTDADRLKSILRRAHERDLQKYEELRRREDDVLFKARVIVRSMDLPMKLSQAEYQKDGRRATLYFTAEGRVDFRELVKRLAREFHTRVEMRQIGARQEAGKIGGIGSCGRELCCSTWLTQFKHVSTSAARYQQLAINQVKLTGQCGRLKCCLNYELDTYMDALREFPSEDVRIRTQEGTAHQIKVDIFRKELYYAYPRDPRMFRLSLDEVNRLIDMNRSGALPEKMPERQNETAAPPPMYAPNDEHVSLETLEQTTRKRKSRRNRKNRNRGQR